MNISLSRRHGLRFAYQLLLIIGLIMLATSQSTSVKALQGVTQSGPLLRLRLAEFDPLTAPPVDLPDLPNRIDAPDQSGLWLVQFPGPIQDNWLEAVAQSGLTIVQYIPDYSYLVWGNADHLQRLVRNAHVRWQGKYLPEYALHPDLLGIITSQPATQSDLHTEDKRSDTLSIVVQIAALPGSNPDIQQILDASTTVIHPPEQFLSVRILHLVFPIDRLAWLAVQPGVIDISPTPEYHKLDEIQGQIMAGNINSSGDGPSGTGYLAWLLGQGFSTNPEDYPIVDITDDGIDDGDPLPQHPDFYTFGDKSRPDRLAYNYNWTGDLLADSRGGHGNLNASVVAGYNNLTGTIYQDPNGYRRGLGINPFGRVAGSKVFGNDGIWDLAGSNGLLALVAKSYNLGARISSNSWGSATNGMYTLDDQIYDALVRDADPSLAGNQGMILVFAAGNSGTTAGSIDSPGNAKNVITVGASENYRPHRENAEPDQCFLSAYEAELAADNAQEIAEFSSRGPTDDGRIKPDLVAPGTTILGAASQAAGYQGDGVCIRYYPTGQTLYTASSGTSHSTPAIAGAASLLYYHYRTEQGAPPSPAMVKAYLVNSARTLETDNAGEDLPSNDQGFGMVDLGMAFDSSPRFLLDQTEIFGSSGETYEIPGNINDPQNPLRVTLAWTDAPGSSISAAYVNDLDLEVEVGGLIYRGNVFNGSVSQTGGAADFRNNIESVYLPAGLNGNFTVRVKARNLAGDGVPGNTDMTDQDFALVIYNARIQAGVIRGNVRQQPGNIPAVGASVWADSSDGRKLFTTVQNNGEYSLTLHENTYTLNAWKYGYLLSSIDDVAIEGDQIITVDFDLNIAPNRTVQGCITDQETDAGLIANVRVLDPLGAIEREMNTSSQEPCYRFNLSEGEYTLLVTSRLHETRELAFNLLEDTLLDVEMVATTRDGILFGEVINSLTNLPLTSVVISVEPGGYQQFTDGEGRYEFQLPPGSYTMAVETRFYEQVDAVEVEVAQSNLTERNFSLSMSQLVWSTTRLKDYLFKSAGEATFLIHLENAGDGLLKYHALERDTLPAMGGEADGEYFASDNRLTTSVRYEWLDASGGERYFLSDDGSVIVPLPFPFMFYGMHYSSVLISNNGALTFNTENGAIPYTNLPLSSYSGTLVAPFWDDLSEGEILVKTFDTAPNRRFVIEWLDRPHWASEGDITFEIVLYESSNNIKFQYLDAEFGVVEYDKGNSATIGIRGPNYQYLQYSNNQPAVTSGTALCLQVYGSLPCSLVDLPWLKVEPSAGILQPGMAVDLMVTILASPTGLPGIFSGGIDLYTNDPFAQPYIDIPVKAFMLYNGVYLPFLRK